MAHGDRGGHRSPAPLRTESDILLDIFHSCSKPSVDVSTAARAAVVPRRRRRDRGTAAGDGAGVETAARRCGEGLGPRSPPARLPRDPLASKPWRRRWSTAADLVCRRRDRGEGGGPQRRILVAGVETVAKAVDHCGRSWSPASRPWRRRRATAADLGRRRRLKDRCEGSGLKISWTSKHRDQF
jgi:hypothetical protein